MPANERIINQGMGGFLNPPSHPEHHWSVETDLNRHRNNRGSMALSSAVTSDYVDDSVREQAKKILSDWEENKPNLSTRESMLWVRRVLAHFKNCYALDGTSWNASDLHICAPFPVPVSYNAFGAPMYATRKGETTYRQPSALGATYCNGGHPLNLHAGVRYIRMFYPDYQPQESDFAAPNCAGCGHHINAHANGDGGICSVIVDMDTYNQVKGTNRVSETLCNCPSFVLEESDGN